MATQTTHYNLIKPSSADRVAVGDLNDNSDIIDGNLFQANERVDQMADDYNASETYNTGDYVRRENYLYKCNTDNTTGTWDATKWDRVKVMDEITQGGGGGSSTLAGLDDVSLATPTDGQLLGYNGTSHKWVNVNGGGGGSSTLAGLNDVNVAGVANKDIIRYNSTSQKYEKSSALTDLELAVSQISASTLGITEGHHILKADGTQMAQEDDLQIVGANIADDGVNGKTVITTNIQCTQAQYDAWEQAGTLLTDVDYDITDSEALAIDATHLPYSSTQSTKQAIDLKLNKITIFTAQATTSANGNIDLRNIINTNKYLVLQAVGLSGSAGVVVCIPYAYSATDAGYIHGLHCINEYANMEVVANTQINLTLYTAEI